MKAKLAEDGAILVEMSRGRFGEIPKEYRLQFEEGRVASEKEAHLRGTLPENPYQKEYNETGSKEALWRAVAWFHGFRQNL